MARYTGPKARVNRRLGALIFENAGAVKAYERRQQPPGMHTRPRRPSNYGLALMEKQKIKRYYGLGESQLRRYFGKATRMKGNTAEELLILCERRLDNVVRRSGYTTTRPQARQGIVHGHFRVNGVKVSSPSFQVRAGDVVTLRDKEKIQDLYRSNITDHPPDSLDWVTLDAENLQATVQGIPGPDDVSLPVDANVVVEFMSR
jgi:small subunit ribosomal protein S4